MRYQLSKIFSSLIVLVIFPCVGCNPPPSAIPSSTSKSNESQVATNDNPKVESPAVETTSPVGEKLVEDKSGLEKSEVPPAKKEDPWSDSQMSFSGFSVLVIPVPLPEGKKRVEIEEVGKRLFTEIAKDPESLAILSRLFNGLKVELIVHEDRQTRPGDTETAPHEGFAVSIRANIFLRDKNDADDGRRSATMASARWKRVRQSQNPTYSSLEAAQKAQPDDFIALILTGNEYLLRNMPGWMLFDGRGSDDIFSFEPPTDSAEKLQAKLHQEIEAYCERFQDKP